MIYDTVNYGVPVHGIPCPTTPTKEAPDVEKTEGMGQRISTLANAKGLSQAEIARRLGLSRMTVSQWFRDVSPNIRPENLLALSALLGTSPHYLVFGATGAPPGGLPPAADPMDPSTTGRFRTPFKRRS